MLLVLFVLFCGAPESPKETLTDNKTIERIAYQRLTEVEVQKLLKVCPMVASDLEKAWEIGRDEKGKPGDSPLDELFYLSEANRKVHGLDAKLKAAGMPWEKFWPVFIKIYAAGEAIGGQEYTIENLKEIDNQLKDPKISKDQKQRLKVQKEAMVHRLEIYAKVPEANRNLAIKYAEKFHEAMGGE